MKKVVFNLVILAGLLSFQSCSDDDEQLFRLEFYPLTKPVICRA